MNYPSPALIAEKKEAVLDRIRTHHLRRFESSRGDIFFISDTYPGVWIEHTYDGIAWAEYDASQREIAKNQILLFIDNQRPDGHLPFAVTLKKIGFSQTQECVSFGSLCLRACDLNPQDGDWLPARCYEALCGWDRWLCANRMTKKTGLIETFCGYDTGHDNSGRLNGMKYPGNLGADASVVPADCPVCPMISPDLNAIFYGNRRALAAFARRLGKAEEAAAWDARAEEVRRLLFETCYDEADRYFYDVDKNGEMRKIKSISLTSLFIEGVLDRDLGREIFELHLHNPLEFWAPFPFPAVAMSDPTWVQNLPGNSWGFYSQGLTALRTLLWMERYGFSSEMEEMMHRWIAAWCASTTTQFGQELHPLTGEPSRCSQWYSSCMLYFLHALKRLGM